MRFIGLAIIILALPGLYAWLRANPRHQPYVWFAIGFMPFVISTWNLDASIISWAYWPGHTKGLIVSLLDAVAVVVLLVRPKVPVSLPLRGIIIAYLLSALISVVFSGQPEAAIFYVWQLGRMLLLFFAVSSICTDPRAPQYIIAGLVCAITLQAGYAIKEKLSGVLQASGTLGHQNLLGMVTHFVLYPSLAILLAGGKRRLPYVGVAAALIVVATGASRATIGLAGAGIILLLLLSMLRRSTGHKMRIAGLGVLALALATPIALSGLEQRFETKGSIDSSNEERKAFENTAKMMLADHPMGVGANQYVVTANTQGYSDRAGVNWNYASRSAHVHNTYLLVAAETGWLGLLCFILFMTVPIFAAFRFSWADRKDPRGDLALGLGVTMTIVAIHCFFEWITVLFVVQYLFAICMGMISGLIGQRRIEKRAILQERFQAKAHEQADSVPIAARISA